MTLLMLYKFNWLLYTVTFLAMMYLDVMAKELRNENRYSIVIAASMLLLVDIWRFIINA